MCFDEEGSQQTNSIFTKLAKFLSLNSFQIRICFDFDFDKNNFQFTSLLTFYNKLMIVRKNLSFFGVLMFILTLTQAINWQGTGNMSQSNLTEIWDYIDTKFKLSWSFGKYFDTKGDTTVVNFTNNFSDYLNKLWDPAWNVVVSYALPNGGDTVLYGYAFRDHWMWHNGIKMDDGYEVAFIIWKDYNCQTWYSINPTQQLMMSSSFFYDQVQAIQAKLNAYRPSVNFNSIWATAFGLTNHLNTMSDFQGKGLSVIFSQQTETKFFARFCAVGFWTSNQVAYQGVEQTNWGKVLLLQMR